VLPQLYQSDAISKSTLQPSKRWQTLLTEPFKQLTHISNTSAESKRLSYYCNALLDSTLVLGINEEQTKVLWESLGKLLRQAVKADSPTSLRTVDLFALGAGFHFFVEHNTDTNLEEELWPDLCRISPICGHSVSFWRGLLALTERASINLSLEGPHVEPLKRALMHCLSSPSHELRLTALSILQKLICKTEESRNIISVAILVEQTPLTLEHQRSIAMRVGQLAKLYPAICSDEWIGEAIPRVCCKFASLRYGTTHAQH
jgi:U3 small nucleolar RNA-associated protein 20